MPYLEFWEINYPKNAPPTCTLKIPLLIEFCSEYLGYYNYVDYTGNYILVLRTNHCIISETKIQDLKQDIKRYIIHEKKEPLAWTAFTNRKVVDNNFVDLLEKLPEINFNLSRKNLAYFFYENGVLEVSPKVRRLIPYQDFTGLLWKEQITKRKFTILGDQASKADFGLFLRNVCNKDNTRFLSLISIIGYLLHPYKDPSFTKCVILLDENINFSGEANGGTGKSLIASAIKHMTPTVWKDGKKHNPNANFGYDDIRPYHRLLYFDDVKKNFSFEEFYTLISGDLKTERKYLASTTIPARLTPKLLISSNYMVNGTGGETDERRRIEFEIAPCYSMAHTPSHDFKQTFFEDWEDREWEQFDNFMIRTVSFFMQKGILPPPQINLAENKLKMATAEEFVVFMDSEVISEKTYDKGDLLSSFIKLCPVHRNLSGIIFKKWFDKWLLARKFVGNHYKSNGRVKVSVTKKG